MIMELAVVVSLSGVCREHRNCTSLVFPHPVSPMITTGMLDLYIHEKKIVEFDSVLHSIGDCEDYTFTVS
jgi:hypothetical protein